MTGRRGRAGFSLMEMLTVMWAMGVALGLGAVLLLAAMRADRVGAATLRTLAWRAELADRFRADVARAAAAPERLGELAAGPARLILRTPGGDHVLYQWQEGRLERVVWSGGRATRETIPVSTRDVSAVAFDRSAGDRPVLTLRLMEGAAYGEPWRTEVSAALGGDLR